MASAPQFDWHLTDWLGAMGLSQTDLQKAAGWSKRKASDLMTGGQRYNRDIVNEAARALNIFPYELLMHPSDAMAIRKLREGGIALASHSDDAAARTGTGG